METLHCLLYMECPGGCQGKRGLEFPEFFMGI
jgi:hypothetical protein